MFPYYFRRRCLSDPAKKVFPISPYKKAPSPLPFFQEIIGSKAKNDQNHWRSTWELTYPIRLGSWEDEEILSHLWDMLVPWRVVESGKK